MCLALYLFYPQTQGTSSIGCKGANPYADCGEVVVGQCWRWRCNMKAPFRYLVLIGALAACNVVAPEPIPTPINGSFSAGTTVTYTLAGGSSGGPSAVTAIATLVEVAGKVSGTGAIYPLGGCGLENGAVNGTRTGNSVTLELPNLVNPNVPNRLVSTVLAGGNIRIAAGQVQVAAVCYGSVATVSFPEFTLVKQ